MLPANPMPGVPALTQRHPPGCPDADWCRGNNVCYWSCKDDGCEVFVCERCDHGKVLTFSCEGVCECGQCPDVGECPSCHGHYLMDCIGNPIEAKSPEAT